MLVLTRHVNEAIIIAGLDITIRVLRNKNGAVRLGIEAPASVKVLREELLSHLPVKAALVHLA